MELKLNLVILLVLTLTFFVILAITYFNISLDLEVSIRNKSLKPSNHQSQKEPNPKKELVEYFAYNWDNLKPYLLASDCQNLKMPENIQNEFKDKFGVYFLEKMPMSDPMVEKFREKHYQREFEMEFREICQTFTKLKTYLQGQADLQSLKLKNLGHHLEWLHNQHFPQAVFISVILDEMVRTCQENPDLSVLEVSKTDSLLTMKALNSVI